MSNVLNFAIIGCGRIGERHAEHINNIGKLAAVCDIDEKKAKEVASKYKVPSFQNIDALLKNNTKEMSFLFVAPMAYMLNIQ